MKLRLAKIKEYLKEPYPYYYDNQQRLILLLLFLSVLSFCFSYFFEPFVVNVAEYKINFIWILLIHAFIPFPIAYIYLSLMNLKVKDDIIWTLGKEIFNLSIILLIIGIVGFLIRDLIYTNPDNWSFRYLWEEIRNTFLIGVLLLIIVLPINLERLINKHTTSLKKLPSNIARESYSIMDSAKKTISIENFELKTNDFLFAKVESNYTEVFTYSTEGVNKKLIRITLKELEEQLNPISSIFKTHRSYLVNLNAIESISGNAQGYQLTLKNYSNKIPVSRSNINGFNAVYSKI
ncbi:LytTR family DNA-binding domain-containing protein [Aquimarina sp. 2201CG5-10]|uniref:LytR/AlgR family response regulator transcription factor n=1 Tax=Aquimarina callyspongiae TaxID=3098150 RepID=UPI002AB40C64|nr:LytTR family DNA-binding domain-containing protein [Aquimarina sp. 2201CG5-10]MDY8135968.1 LytTR family DNA-binding domain-containing protein [Aquimarina sp. 2201CG5-10]